MHIQPYLFFDGRCEEAFEFYGKALGGQLLMKMRFGDSPEPHPPEMCPPGSEDRIMHAAMKIGETVLMASDGVPGQDAGFKGISLSLTVGSDEEAAKVFAALSEGGKVEMPLAKSFFASSFGMLSDRFGVGWMIVAGAQG